MGISLDGLASGLDTTALISSVMQVEAIPQTLLKYKSQDLQSMVSALQGLNSKVAALATQATAAAKPGALDLNTATTSSDKVTATTTAAAKAGSIDFQVTKLAQTQVTVTPKVNAVVGWPYTTMTINSGGQAYTIEPLSSNLDDVVKSVNAAGAGVTASKVAVGAGEYRLQFTATKSGEAGAFTITIPAPRSPTSRRRRTQRFHSGRARSTAQVREILDQHLHGSAARRLSHRQGSQCRSRHAHRGPRRRRHHQTRLRPRLRRQWHLLLTWPPGPPSRAPPIRAGASTTAGIFAGDSAVRSVNQSILSAASLPVGTPPRSPSEIGISITKTGTMEFDEKKFSAALAADPAGTAAKVQEIATRIAAAATTASDKYDGTLTKKITGQQSEVRDLADRISDWDTRLESRKATLQRTYSGLEVALSNMQAQQSWLTAQLGGLSSGSNSA